MSQKKLLTFMSEKVRSIFDFQSETGGMTKNLRTSCSHEKVDI